MAMRTQRGLRTCDEGDKEAKEAKRRRRNTAGRWAASKGNDLADDGDVGGSKGGSKGGRKGAKK